MAGGVHEAFSTVSVLCFLSCHLRKFKSNLNYKENNQVSTLRFFFPFSVLDFVILCTYSVVVHSDHTNYNIVYSPNV